MKALAKLRRQRGLTQTQLGDMAGLDQSTISKIESGEYNYTSDVIKALSTALAVEPAELFGLPELQERVATAIREISDPEEQKAVLTVVESMASRARR